MVAGLNEKEPEDDTVTVSGSTDGLDLPLEWLGKAKEWDGPVVLNSPQFVEPKPQKCPVCEGSGQLAGDRFSTTIFTTGKAGLGASNEKAS